MECLKCMMYGKEQDELWQDFNDALPITESHICAQFPEGIPKEIWDGKKSCPYSCRAL